nr:hypothetical protein Iba_chr12aCG14420 [Ipomoea batatas]
MATSRKLVLVLEYSLFHSSRIILLGGKRSRGFFGFGLGASSSSTSSLGFASSFLASFFGSSFLGFADSFGCAGFFDGREISLHMGEFLGKGLSHDHLKSNTKVASHNDVSKCDRVSNQISVRGKKVPVNWQLPKDIRNGEKQPSYRRQMYTITKSGVQPPANTSINLSS